MRRAFDGNYPVTREFGVKDPAYANYPGSKHPGTDYGVPANTPLKAGISGWVTTYDRPAGIKVGRGKEVIITDGDTERKYCHMNRIDVPSGRYVSEGTTVGLSGYTGYVVDAQGKVGTPGGAHLHDELLIDGQYLDLEEQNLEEEEMPNDGDITNMARFGHQDPNYKPPKNILDHYKNPKFGWKALAYDMRTMAQEKLDQQKAKVAELEKQQAVNRDTVVDYINKKLP